MLAHTTASAPNASTSLDDEEAFLARARATMKKCQVGTNRLDTAHEILADCYGTIGRLIFLLEGAKSGPGTAGEPG